MLDARAGLYCRLSVEDDEKGSRASSESIETQKMILTDFCKREGFAIVEFYVDDGVSGTTFSRPAFQRMQKDIEAGKINVVICKDLSRLGRSYIVESFLQGYFPEKGVRFIAVDDRVDSQNGEYDISVPIRNLLNSEYPKDISRKTKNAKKARAKSGLFIGSKAPFGYVKDPTNKNRLIIDPEARYIVRRIFDMALSGYGYNTIARMLREDKIPTPAEYARQHGLPNCSRVKYEPGREYAWNPTSVSAILSNPAYLGDTVQARRGNSKMHGKQIKRDKEDWITVHATHEPIVSAEEWEQVQQQLTVRRRASADGTPQMFAGLLYCADCGRALSFTRIPRKTLPDTGKYRCAQFLRYGRECCSSHTIYQHQLVDAVLTDIRDVASLAVGNRDELLTLLSDKIADLNAEKNTAQKAVYERNLARREEISRCEKALFEKNALGLIDDEQYIRFNSEYRKERELIDAQIAEYEAETVAAQSNGQDPEKFAALIAKYADIQSLDARILNTLIERILVHEKVNGIMQIEIIYRFAGKLPESK